MPDQTVRAFFNIGAITVRQRHPRPRSICITSSETVPRCLMPFESPVANMHVSELCPHVWSRISQYDFPNCSGRIAFNRGIAIGIPAAQSRHFSAVSRVWLVQKVWSKNSGLSCVSCLAAEYEVTTPRFVPHRYQ